MIEPVPMQDIATSSLAAKLNEVIAEVNRITEITDRGVVNSAQHVGPNGELRIESTLPRSERP